jgi:hypothetical protein
MAGRRLARLRASHSFGIILLMILAQFLFVALAPSETWCLGVIVFAESITLAVALWTTGAARRGRTIDTALIVAGAAGATVQVLFPDSIYQGLLGLALVVLAIITCSVIGRGVLDQGAVNQQSVRGAIAVYVLLGLTYTYLYGAIASLDSNTFFAQGTDGTLSLRLYFSFITMTTVGYGDYSPASSLGKTMAVTEALAGQLYLVTAVAGVVSQYRPRRSVTEETPEDLRK